MFNVAIKVYTIINLISRKFEFCCKNATMIEKIRMTIVEKRNSDEDITLIIIIITNL